MCSVISPDKTDEDLDIELSLRPQRLDDFVGQGRLKENLAVFIQAAKERQEALDHVLLYGPPGLGKTTLANIISRELTSQITTTSGPVLEKAVKRSAKILNVEIDDDGAIEIAKRSRGTPRVANRLLRRIRDFAQVKADNCINKTVAEKALEKLEVDSRGFDEMDKRILLTIIEKFSGGPVGVNTIAVAVSEESNTIEELYEPFLIQQGYLKRTARGREVTRLAYEHFNMTFPGEKKNQGDLFSKH
jgi:Holliday junction resolvasome RuvABC ATP-dependent DNA helicase subunit